VTEAFRSRTAGAAYEGRKVLVAGTGVAGEASATVLIRLGADVTVVDRRDGEAVERLRAAGAAVVLAEVPPADLVESVDEVVVSPGFAPDSPLARLAEAAGTPVCSEPELAWRLRGPGAPPWLAVTGTDGKTTTVTMLGAMLRAAGHRVEVLGNIGEPLVYAAVEAGRFDALAVELSSFQLHWSSTLAPEAGAILNLADDHLEWHGGFEAYARAKRAIWRSADDGPGLAVGNLDDPIVAGQLARVRGRTVGFSVVAAPGPRRFVLADGVLVDGEGREIIAAGAIRPPGRHNVANALAAAALAASYGTPIAAIRDGLAGYVPQPHRNALVTTVDGVTYVDDSKATNPHAAHASLTAYPRVVWIVGGQLKGVDIGDLVAAVRDRLAGAVLLGIDRDQVAAALARHAPDVPVVTVTRTDDGAMSEVVRAAATLARPGDTVLLAPAAASKDMFVSYGHRGDAFAEAVRSLSVEVSP
jgi:UDP-N-acetylmuramoylalanine--D-glutamate ligase